MVNCLRYRVIALVLTSYLAVISSPRPDDQLLHRACRLPSAKGTTASVAATAAAAVAATAAAAADAVDTDYVLHCAYRVKQAVYQILCPSYM